MRVLATGLTALLGLALANSASAQFSTQKPTPPTKPGVSTAPATPTGGSMALLVGGGDSCATPDMISGSGTFAFDTTTATTGAEGQNECGSIYNDVWFAWTATSSGIATVSTCNQAAFDTKLAAYPGGACPANGTSLACNDDACSLQSSVAFPVTNGSVYLVQVGSFSSSASGTGNIDITVSQPPTNDDCASPMVISGNGPHAFDLTLASTGSQGQSEGLCYSFGTTGIDNDVWFQWTAGATGTATMSTCAGATFDTKIAAYPSGGCPTSGSALACNDDACSLQSSIDIPVTAGTTYLLQVGTFPGAAGGAGSFDITLGGPPSLGTPYCFGDGSGTACPCGNTGAAGRGCANGTGSGGALLSASGSASVGAANLVLAGTGAEPSQPGLYFQGDNTVNGGAGITFGDGIRCAGGNVARLQVVIADANGDSATTVNVASQGGVAPGDVKRYQWWYRSPTASPCGTGFNLSNGLEITWLP